MNERFELNQNKTEVEDNFEKTNFYPEIYANSPLQETALVYTVPVRGEWENGNLTRMLQAMFSQHMENAKPFEVEIITNIERSADPEKKAESEKSVDFLKEIVEIQRLARMSVGDDDLSLQMRGKINAIDDVLLRNIVELAIIKAEKISLTLIDATKTDFSQTEYKEPGIGTFRTLGADIAAERFNNPETVIAMFDVDSLVEGNRSVEQIENIFKNNPQLHYFFAGMSYLPSGHSKEFISGSPKESMGRTMNYNSQSFRGSPQIYFRRASYERLQEISAGPQHSGFQGHEDFDTGRKLVYYFGKIQDGLLLEGSCFMPTSLTSDRLDGFMDSAVRHNDFINKKTEELTEDVQRLIGFRKKIMKFIEKLPEGKKEIVLKELERARDYYLKRQKVQQRFNKVILNSLLQAKEKGFIRIVAGEVNLNEEEILKMQGGKALLHYVRVNKKVISEALSSDDEQVIRYYLGKEKCLPNKRMTSFQLAVREYLGDVSPISPLIEEFKDERLSESKDSLLHPFSAETLALGHIYSKYFEPTDLLPSEEEYANPEGYVGMKIYDWPKDGKKIIKSSFGDPIKRRAIAKEQINERQHEIPTKKKGFFSFPIRSIPIFELFRFLTTKK